MKNTHGTRTKRAACALSALALTLTLAPNGAQTALASNTEAHYTSGSVSAQEQSAGNLLNSDRARYGLAALTIDPELSRIARIKSEDMRDQQYFAHTSPTYGDVRNMLTLMGYSYVSASENIAHHATVEKAQAAFLSSPGHRRNVLSKNFTRVGIGIAYDAQGFVYLTQIFCR